MTTNTVDFNKIDELAKDVNVHASYASKILNDRKNGIFPLSGDNQLRISEAQLTYQLNNLAKERAAVRASTAPAGTKAIGIAEIDKSIKTTQTALNEINVAKSMTRPPLPAPLMQEGFAVDTPPATTNPAASPAPVKEPKKENTAKEDAAKAPVKTVINPRRNPLFEYASYTYNLSLHIVPPEKYNEIANSTSGDYSPGYKGKPTVLVASAGKWDKNTFARHPIFKKDYFFDNLKMSTIVGMNKANSNTNAIDISFDIIEPMGITFLDNLIAVVRDFNLESWMQVPFVLQIDFAGHKNVDQEYKKIKDQTKYIPIKIIGCDVGVTTKGTTYKISAIPFSHQAMQGQVATTPARFEVTAKKLEDFFSVSGDAGEAKNISALNKQLTLSRKEEAKQYTTSGLGIGRIPGASAALKQTEEKNFREKQKALSETYFKVGSYTAAMNDYQHQLQKNGLQEYPDSFEFIFDETILKGSKIVIPKKTDTKNTPMYSASLNEAVLAIRNKAGLPTAGITLDDENFAVEKGTSIVQLLNYVMLQTDYIRNQITDSAVDLNSAPQDIANKLDKPINWFKVTAKINIGEKFDKIRKMYPRKITYYIQKYEFFNTKDSSAQKSLPSSVAKEYDYLFTGRNESILDFKIDFNTMFYTSVTANRSKVAGTAINQNKNEPDKENKPKEATDPKISELRQQPTSGDASAQDATSSDSKTVAVNDFTSNSLSDSRGDMINVNLRIIGDPEFIKQDDVFYMQPNAGANSKSLPFDSGELHCRVRFKSYDDYDYSTGLVISEKVNESSFSGIYRVLTVENEFRSGKFEQTLNLVRLFGQDDLDPPEKKKSSREKTTEQKAKTLDGYKAAPVPSTPLAQEGFAVDGPVPTPSIPMAQEGFAVDATTPAGTPKLPFGDVVSTGATNTINGGLYANTSDSNLTYGGDDYIVWDRINAERTRRGLPGLASIGSPRPAQ